ncbi:hypothetical protein Tco_0669983 [Tanacetum coccineum]
MSLDNASSAVTYTSISSDSDRPSWGILLVNVDELPDMDLYEEVAQQGQTPPLSPAYVPDPIELDKHDQPYADDASPIAESLGHIADSESMEEDSIDYPYEPEDNDEDSEEDPKEDHTDYSADGEDGDDEPSDDDTNDEDEEPTKDKEEDKYLAPADSYAVPVVDHVPLAGDIEAFETDESTPTPRSLQTRVPFCQTRLLSAASSKVKTTSTQLILTAGTKVNAAGLQLLEELLLSEG